MITGEFEAALRSSSPETNIRAILTWLEAEPPRKLLDSMDKKSRRQVRQEHYNRAKEALLRNLSNSDLKIDNPLTAMPKAVISGPARAWREVLERGDSPLRQGNIRVNADFTVSAF